MIEDAVRTRAATVRPDRVRRQGLGRRLHLSNVLNITKRTSLLPPERPDSDDSRAWPKRTFTRVLQGPENSSASPAPTTRTYPSPKSSTLWIQPACTPVSTRSAWRIVKAYEVSATRPRSKWKPDPLKPRTRAERKSPSSKREKRSRLRPSNPDRPMLIFWNSPRYTAFLTSAPRRV